MFFSVTLQPDSRFPFQHPVDQFWFNCDSGWQKITSTVFRKGYYDNYCQVNFDQQQARICHNTFRTFPLWYKSSMITNLPVDDLDQAWADDVVAMDSEGKIKITKSQLDLSVPAQTLTIEKAVDKIKSVLDMEVERFAQSNPQNLKLFFSGGLDTTLLLVLLKHHRVNFELVTDRYYQEDHFTTQNAVNLNQFWAYNQLHHWTDPTWLATGSCGDEYFLRGPAVIATMTAWHGIPIHTLLDNNPNAYHYHHFCKYADLWQQTWQFRDQLREQYADEYQLKQQIINILINDHQHWHLGNTLTWTPFHSIDIVKTLLSCSINDLVPQFLDGQLTKQIIELYDPRALSYVSTYKNIDSQENLKKLLENQ